MNNFRNFLDFGKCKQKKLRYLTYHNHAGTPQEVLDICMNSLSKHLRPNLIHKEALIVLLHAVRVRGESGQESTGEKVLYHHIALVFPGRSTTTTLGTRLHYIITTVVLN